MEPLDHDLFSYPQQAGYKEHDTSKKAAETVDAKTLRGLVLQCFDLHRFMTADECAGYLGRSILSIRPRFSELKTMGKIYDTKVRHPNDSGKPAKVWGRLEGSIQ